MTHGAGSGDTSGAGVLATVQTALVEHFGQQPHRASVSFVGVDPIEVLRFEPVPGERAYVSLGMSRHPMTGANEAVLTSEGPRAELMLHVRDPLDVTANVWRRVAVLAAAPAVEGVVYTEGMTVDLGEPLLSGSVCTGVVVTDSPLRDVAVAGPPGRVRVLQAVPVTANELAWSRVHGTTALLDALSRPEVDTLDLERRSVALD